RRPFAPKYIGRCTNAGWCGRRGRGWPSRSAPAPRERGRWATVGLPPLLRLRRGANREAGGDLSGVLSLPPPQSALRSPSESDLETRVPFAKSAPGVSHTPLG